MEARDRFTNLALLGAAAVLWVLVALVVTSRDPYEEPLAGYVGALAMGLALGVTTIPLFWLVIFGRHRRIAYQGDWPRAARRGGWVALVTVVMVLLRIQGVLQLPIALFIIAMVFIAEVTLSAER
jgi:hypothetical protein